MTWSIKLIKHKSTLMREEGAFAALHHKSTQKYSCPDKGD